MNNNPIKKFNLHKRNKHSNGYDFDQLLISYPPLSEFVAINKFGNESVNFFDPKAVKALNTALLFRHYNVEYWDVPDGYLCPPIPGRADHIHYINDLLDVDGISKEITCLDIGCGANCIYPILGVAEYNWRFVGSDIDHKALQSAQKIVDNNKSLNDKVDLRYQPDSNMIYTNVIKEGEYFDIVICNPPFHASAQEANDASTRKVKNLTKGKSRKTVLNFGGKSNELWTEGGEYRFVSNMINESVEFSKSVNWFTTLISKGADLGHHFNLLDDIEAKDVKTITTSQGNKISRLLAWRF